MVFSMGHGLQQGMVAVGLPCAVALGEDNYVSQNKCTEILMCLLSALAHLHSLNVVHRDVKAVPGHSRPDRGNAGSGDEVE